MIVKLSDSKNVNQKEKKLKKYSVKFDHYHV